MSKPTEVRLAHVLDTTFLARVVPHLAPETLHQLIRCRGLEAAGELVASATPAQLTAVLDLDLWRHPQPGRDEQFDVERFGDWLEVLVDTGDSAAARTVAALDKSLVVEGLSRYVRVFDPGIFEPTAQSDDESIDRHEAMHEGDSSSGDPLECEVGGYLVRARRTDAWDAIVTLLATLDADHNLDFHAVMQGCRRLSNSRPEIDGLDDLLMTPEQHLHDVARSREQRRSRRGYATPADARAFLQMARQPQDTSRASAPIAINPVAAAYFRAVEEEEDLLANAGLLRQGHGGHGVTPERPRALLEAADGDPSTELRAGPRAARLPLLKRLLEFLLHHDESAYLMRSRELAFLANTLQAGSSVQSRPFTPQEASDAAACVCNLGLECWPASRSLATDTFLVDHDLVAVFEAGWSVLYRDVSLVAADQLIATLADLHCADADTRREVRALQRQLATQRAVGAPWLARDACDVLASFDLTAWISVLGLLDECPILPAALTAILEGRTTSVSPTAFEFISTTAQIGDIRIFMTALPGVLSR
jgi:hypothetical protein